MLSSLLIKVGLVLFGAIAVVWLCLFIEIGNLPYDRITKRRGDPMPNCYRRPYDDDSF